MWRKESREKVFVEGKDKSFPKKILKAEVPSAKKKCFSWWTVKN